MVSLRNFRKEVVTAHTASRKIQWFWKKRLDRTRRRRRRLDLENLSALKVQMVVRCRQARRKVNDVRARLRGYKARTITRFMRFAQKEVGRKRGRKRKHDLHATRLQAFVRGCLVRDFLPLNCLF